MTTSSLDSASPVRVRPVAGAGQPDVTPALEELYRGFEQELLVPLWTEVGDLMPVQPQSAAVPHRWRWDQLRQLAAQAGQLVPVGRGGERRAIALANPGLGGRPFATPTLWAAIQYLMPGEDAPEHRHTQHAFRFVVEGAGVWSASPAVTLIAEYEAIGAGIKKPAMPASTSRTRTTMQDDGWLPIWIATGLPIDKIAVTHLQQTLLVRLDLRI